MFRMLAQIKKVNPGDSIVLSGEKILIGIAKETLLLPITLLAIPFGILYKVIFHVVKFIKEKIQ